MIAWIRVNLFGTQETCGLIFRIVSIVILHMNRHLFIVKIWMSNAPFIVVKIQFSSGRRWQSYARVAFEC